MHESAEPGPGYANLNVLPQRRGGGVGRALLAAAEQRLRAIGARVAYGKVVDEPAAVGFAERHGYRRGRSTTHLRLDLTTGALPLVSAPPGVRITTAATLAGDPRPRYEADLDASPDKPGDVGPDAVDFAD